MSQQATVNSRARVWLLSRSGPLAGTRVPASEGAIRIGRAPDNDVVVDGADCGVVSLYHTEMGDPNNWADLRQGCGQPRPTLNLKRIKGEIWEETGREGRALPPHLQSAMDAGELQIYRNFLAGQDKEWLRELYAQAWNDCKLRNSGQPNARAIQLLVQVWRVLKGR